MPIDPDVALGAELPEVAFTWSESDVLLYHLALGAGSAPGDNLSPTALSYTVEGEHLQVLPSFGVVAPGFHGPGSLELGLPGCEIDLASVLHGSQSIALHAPLPTSGSAVLRTRISELWDKGKAAVIVQEGVASTEDGTDLWTVRSAIFVRGEGGWGGERGPSTRVELPDREPDVDTCYDVSPQQALLYRLCGDRNPLHADPDFAARAGFPAPILHGLCTYGMVLRTVTDSLLAGDASRAGGFSARFAGVVFPGESVRVRAWDDGERVLVDAQVAGKGDRAGSPVLADAVLTRR